MPENFLDKSSEGARYNSRYKIAAAVAVLINCTDDTSVPYLLNNSDKFEFAVDQRNDWYLTFDKKDEHVFYLRHRYNHGTAIRALSAWVAYRLDVELIDKSADDAGEITGF